MNEELNLDFNLDNLNDPQPTEGRGLGGLCRVDQAKHYTVLTIEKLLELASRNRWGLCKKDSFIYLYNRQHWAEIKKEGFQMLLSRFLPYWSAMPTISNGKKEGDLADFITL